MVPEATWQVGNPAHRIQYSCAGQPAVVEYDYGKGHVVWWASSTPLENGSLARAANLDLLLNSLGPREGHHFYWDESLHGDVRSNWSYAAGPARERCCGSVCWSSRLLIVFSFSRRSGPVRELPPPARATPIEFLEALGSLYRSAGASSTAVTVAWERFRRYSSAPVRIAARPHRRRRTRRRDSPPLSQCRPQPRSRSGGLRRGERGAKQIDPRAALKLIQTAPRITARCWLKLQGSGSMSAHSRKPMKSTPKRKGLMSQEGIRPQMHECNAESQISAGLQATSQLIAHARSGAGPRDLRPERRRSKRC